MGVLTKLRRRSRNPPESPTLPRPPPSDLDSRRRRTQTRSSTSARRRRSLLSAPMLWARRRRKMAPPPRSPLPKLPPKRPQQSRRFDQRALFSFLKFFLYIF